MTVMSYLGAIGAAQREAMEVMTQKAHMHAVTAG